MNASRFAISPNRSKVPERRSTNRTISSSLRGVSSLKLRPAQCGCRYSLQRVPPRKVLEDFCGVRFSVANAASRARRNTRSLAIFVRSARARCSYSGMERGPPDSGSCLKKSAASSLEVMKLSSALDWRPAQPMLGSAHRQPRAPRCRNRCLGAPAQYFPRPYQVDVHNRESTRQNGPRLSKALNQRVKITVTTRY